MALGSKVGQTLPSVNPQSHGRGTGVSIQSYCASTMQRKPSVPARSLPGAISSSLPCSVNRYACGKYHMEPCG